MARLWSSGFELNSLVTNVEFSLNVGDGSIDSSIVRSGSYSYKAIANGALHTSYIQYLFSTVGIATGYFRFYMRVTTDFDGAHDEVFAIIDKNNTYFVEVRMTSTRRLQLIDSVNGAQIGSDSSILNLNQWYRVELKIDRSTPASTIEDIRIDGISFASSTIDTTLGHDLGEIEVGIGVDGNLTTGVVYYDDLAINTNDWAGAGSIIHMLPANNNPGYGWLKQDGSAASSTNYQKVNEVTPDDATTYVKSNTVDNEDAYQLTASGIGASDTVTLASIGVRYSGSSAINVSSFRLEVNINGGISTASITPNATAWNTNANATPFNYPFTAYVDANNNPITQTSLDATQIGILNLGSNTNFAQVSTLWLLVEYVPAAATTTTTSTSTTTSTTTTSTSTTTTTTSTSTSSTTTSTSSSTTTTSTSTTTSTTTTSTSTTTSTTTTSTSTSTTHTTTSTSSSSSTTTTSTSSSSSTTTSTTTTSTSTTQSTTTSTSTTTTSTSSSSSTSTTLTMSYDFSVDRPNLQM